MIGIVILLSVVAVCVGIVGWFGANQDVWEENRRLNALAARVPALEEQLAAAQREITRLKVVRAALLGPRDNRTRVAPQYHAPIRLPGWDEGF